VDRDEKAYPAEVLFAWREEHDAFVAAELGSATDKTLHDTVLAKVEQFRDYPPLIRRIAIDQPPGWEWQLTAELMRHLNGPMYRRLQDLNDDLYVLEIEHVGRDEIEQWIANRCHEMSSIMSPLSNLPGRLNIAWGEQGKSGDIDEIHHVCLLIRETLAQVVRHEERVHFARVPDEFEKIRSLLEDCMGSQARKLSSIPQKIDHILSLIGTDHGGTPESPTVFREVIEFSLPEGWVERLSREIKRAKKSISRGNSTSSNWGVIIIFIVIFTFFLF